jgi:hypothetical protein
MKNPINGITLIFATFKSMRTQKSNQKWGRLLWLERKSTFLARDSCKQ